MSDQTVTITVSAKNLTAQEFAKAKKSMLGVKDSADALDTSVKKSGRSFGDLGRAMASTGRTLSIGITAPILAIGAAALKTGVDFNRSMANVATLIPGNTARVIELKKSVQDMAIATGKSTTDLSEGLFQVVSAFGDTSDTAKILEISARAAAAGVATTTDAINLTSAVTKGYGDTSDEAVQHVADLAFQANKLGQTTFPELAGSMGRVVPLAVALKVSQEELFGVMATATGVTGNTAEVSTQLRGVLQSLLAPTEDMSDMFDKLGVSSGKALLEQRGLQGTINTVVAAAEAAGLPLQKYLGSIEGQTLALALAGPQADTFTTKLAAMQNVAGLTDEAFREQTEGVNKAGFAWNQFKQEIIVASQKLGDVLLPIVMDAAKQMRPLFDVVRDLFAEFEKLPRPMKTLGVAAVGLVAVIGPAIGGLGWAIGAVTAAAPLLGAALAVATGPIGLVALAVGGVAAAVLVFKNNLDAALEQSTRRATAMSQEAKEMERVAQAARDLDAANKPLVAGMTVVIESFRQEGAAADQAGAAAKRLTKDQIAAAKKAAQELNAIRAKSIADEQKQQADFATHQAKLSDARAKKEIDEIAAAFQRKKEADEELAEKDFKATNDLLQKRFDMEREAAEKVKRLRISTIIDSTVKELPGLLQQAFTGGGGVLGGLKATMSGLGSKLGEKLFTGLQKTATAGLSKILGSSIGTALGTMLPGIGQAVGALLGPVLGKVGGAVKNFFGGLFGGGERKKVEKMRGAFVEAAGRLEVLRTKAAAAGLSLDPVFRAKKVKDFDAAVQALNEGLKAHNEKLLLIRQTVDRYGASWDQLPPKMQAARSADLLEGMKTDIDLLVDGGFEFHEALRLVGGSLTDVQKEMLGLTGASTVNWKNMQEAAKKYGVDLTALGPQFEQAKLTDQANDILRDFQLLRDSGADAGAVIGGMSDEVQELLDKAQETGAKLPEAMRPMLEAFVESGELVDENGDKLTDLSTLNFAEPIEEKFDTLIDKIGDLIAALTDGVPLAAGRAVDGIDRQFRGRQYVVPVKFDVDPLRLPNGPRSTVQGAAAGGLFERPAFRVIAERGPEVVGSPNAIVDALTRAMRQTGFSSQGMGGDIFIAVDQGQARRLTRDQFRQIQDGLSTGVLRVRADAITQR